MAITDQALAREIIEAISYFIERQQLVVQLLKDLDIDQKDMGRWGNVIWTQQGKQAPHMPLSTSEVDKELWAAIERAHLRKPVSQNGIWGNSSEWTYFLHGKGCTLHNNVTGEPIDWDCPNPYSFDRYFFLEHLKWRLKTEKNNLELIRRERTARNDDKLEFVIQTLKKMLTEKLINPDYTLPQH